MKLLSIVGFVVLCVAAAVAITVVAPRAGVPDAGPEPAAAALDAPGVTVRVGPRRIGTSALRIGATHTEQSLSAHGDTGAVTRAMVGVRSVIAVQNQHLYGWGAVNPEPSPGVYDWASLDRRVALMRRLRAEPVLTLCCAPDWMTALGTHTSTYPNLPPAPRHVADFARLAVRVARRYPDVRRFVVWNEFKGLWNARRGWWDVERYTALYNAVYDALKAHDPTLLVGGPYLNVRGTGSRSLGRKGPETGDPLLPQDRAVLAAWRRDAHGADFVAVDRNVTPQHDRNRYSRLDQLRLARWFGDIAQQVHGATGLPVWFMEAHMNPGGGSRFRAAATGAMLMSLVRGGASAALLWGLEAPADHVTRGDASALVTDTRVAGGGRPLPAFAVVRAIAAAFPPGTPLLQADVSDPSSILALASPRNLLLLNLRGRRTDVVADGHRTALGAYAAAVIPRAG